MMGPGQYLLFFREDCDATIPNGGFNTFRSDVAPLPPRPFIGPASSHLLVRAGVESRIWYALQVLEQACPQRGPDPPEIIGSEGRDAVDPIVRHRAPSTTVQPVTPLPLSV